MVLSYHCLITRSAQVSTKNPVRILKSDSMSLVKGVGADTVSSTSRCPGVPKALGTCNLTKKKKITQMGAMEESENSEEKSYVVIIIMLWADLCVPPPPKFKC